MTMEAESSGATTEAAMLDFKVDRELLDSAFDGYQLCTDVVPIQSLSLDDYEVHVGVASAAQWSFQHVSLFGRQQYVFADPFHRSEGDTAHWRCVSWFTRCGQIVQAVLHVQTGNWISGPVRTHQFSAAEWSSDSTDEYFGMLVFLSDEMSLAATPNGHLALFQKGSLPWKVQWSGRWDGAGSYAILDACQHSEDTVYVLLQTLVEDPMVERVPGAGSAFVTTLRTLVLRCVDGEWRLEACGRALCTRGNVLHAALQQRPGGDCPLLLAMSSMHLHARVDIANSNTKTAGNGVARPAPLYSWSQSEDQVCCTLDLKEYGVKKDSIKCQFENNAMVVQKDGCVLLQGKLGGHICVVDSTWFIDDNRLEIVLSKQSGSTNWTTLVVNDQQGVYEPDPDNMQAVLARLQQVTSEKMLEGDEGQGKEPYNAQQLEDCDVADSDNLFLTAADASGRQLLFTLPRGADTPPMFCLRHDVDGLVWMLDAGAAADGRLALKHVGTLNAFGFVLASKVKRQYVTCSPSYGRAALTEPHRRVFIYESSRPVGAHSQLYNRKRKQLVGAVAAQRMLQVPDDERVVALQMLHDRDGDLVVVATRRRLHALHLGKAAPHDVE